MLASTFSLKIDLTSVSKGGAVVPAVGRRTLGSSRTFILKQTGVISWIQVGLKQRVQRVCGTLSPIGAAVTGCWAKWWGWGWRSTTAGRQQSHEEECFEINPLCCKMITIATEHLPTTSNRSPLDDGSLLWIYIKPKALWVSRVVHPLALNGWSNHWSQECNGQTDKERPPLTGHTLRQPGKDCR